MPTEGLKKLRMTEAVNLIEPALLFVLFIVYLVPVVWAITSSFKPGVLIMAFPPRFVFAPTAEHYIRLHIQWNFFKKLVNSLIISSATTGISMGVGILAAFALSRYRFPNFIPIWILSNRFLPVVAILFPLFIWFRSLNLIDTYIAIVLTNLVPNVAFAIWLLRGFFDEIPVELDESAKIDGCHTFMLLWRIILPIAKPSLAVCAVFIFLFSWNEFLIPLVLSRTETTPVTVAFAGFKENYRFDWGAMCAGSVISLLPLLMMIIFLQKYIIRGMTLGAVKG